MKILLIYIIILPILIEACCNNNCQTECCTTCQTRCYTGRCINKCQRECCQTHECTTTTKRTTTAGKIEIGDRSTTSTTPRAVTLSNHIASDIRVDNIINNENRINFSVNVNNNNENHISTRHEGGTCSNGTRGETCHNSTVIKEVRVLVPVKVPIQTPVMVQPCAHGTCQPQRCCRVVVPCVDYGCYPYRYHCNNCDSTGGYLPINPCGVNGCYRRPFWYRRHCSMGRWQCVMERVDCSYCRDDFYTTYDGFSQCHGCFYH